MPRCESLHGGPPQRDPKAVRIIRQPGDAVTPLTTPAGNDDREAAPRKGVEKRVHHTKTGSLLKNKVRRGKKRRWMSHHTGTPDNMKPCRRPPSHPPGHDRLCHHFKRLRPHGRPTSEHPNNYALLLSTKNRGGSALVAAPPRQPPSCISEVIVYPILGLRAHVTIQPRRQIPLVPHQRGLEQHGQRVGWVRIVGKMHARMLNTILI